ncbi:MAG: mechanosensitive ion channel family protein [Bacteroidales bacterium]
MFTILGNLIRNIMLRLGATDIEASHASDLADFIGVLFIGVLLYYLAKLIIIRVLKRIAKQTKSIWDDVLLEKKVFNRMAFLLPGILIYQFAPATLEEFPGLVISVVKVTNLYIVFVVLLIINSFFNAVYAIYEDTEFARLHPIKGYIQVAKIIVFIVGGILILSYLFNQTPLYLLGGLGAFSAVMLLIFKDPILGLVGGIQLSANDMVRKGDWINMPKFSADGTVVEISLTTVKVQNWDNTITTLPTYSLVSDAFQNYRGMQESGGRRLKRSININMQSVKFCTPEMLERFRKIRLISEYVDQKEAELNTYNIENNIDDEVLINGRRQTNLGVFRAYLEAFLQNHPMVHQDMTLLVRQLQPTDLGIPMEIYVFSRITEWAAFENLQSDIFDHILAIIPLFDLQVFQSPTGDDFRKLSDN